MGAIYFVSVGYLALFVMEPNCNAVVLAQYGAQMSVELPGEASSLIRRAVALMIDWVACLLVAKLVAPALEIGESPFLPLVIFFIEVTLLTWFVAASFGQRLVGIQVIGIDGQRLMLWRIALRTLLICLVIPAVIFDSQGRGIHDRTVGSVAILRKPSN